MTDPLRAPGTDDEVTDAYIGGEVLHVWTSGDGTKVTLRWTPDGHYEWTTEEPPTVDVAARRIGCILMALSFVAVAIPIAILAARAVR